MTRLSAPVPGPSQPGDEAVGGGCLIIIAVVGLLVILAIIAVLVGVIRWGFFG